MCACVHLGGFRSVEVLDPGTRVTIKNHHVGSGGTVPSFL